jgi:hypothetical protein
VISAAAPLAKGRCPKKKNVLRGDRCLSQDRHCTLIVAGKNNRDLEIHQLADRQALERPLVNG